MDHNKMLNALKKLAETITQTFDVDALLLGILTACLEVSQAGRGALYLLDDGGTALALRAKIGFSPNALIDVRHAVPSKARECRHSKLGSVYRNGNPVTLDFRSSILCPQDGQPGSGPCVLPAGVYCHGWAGIPISNNNDKIIGVITLHNVDGSSRWKQSLADGWEFLLSLAGLVSSTIAKIGDRRDRLFDAIRALVEDLGVEGELHGKIVDILHTFDRISGADGTSIWLIDGSRLRCCYAVGHYEALLKRDKEGYDLVADPEKGSIGITAWIAKSGEFVHTKTPEQEKAHPHYLGRLDSLLYEAESNRQSFLGAPLRIQREIIGVIKSNKLTKPDGTSYFFTEEDAQQFRFLALIAAGAIKIARDMERAKRADQMVIKLYEIGTRCNDLSDTNEILWYFLVGLTNERGIGVNRAAWFDIKEVDGQLALQGRMAIGPVNERQGIAIHERIDIDRERVGWGLDDILNAFRDNDSCVPKPSGELQSYIEGLSVAVDDYSPLHQFLVDLRGPTAQRFCFATMGEKARAIFQTLDFKEGIVFGLPLGEGRRLLGFCDYVYTPVPERLSIDDLIRFIEVFLKQIQLAIQRRDLRQSQDRVREQAWQEFRSATAHRIGTEVADISGALRKLRFLSEYSDEGARNAFTRIASSLERMREAVTDYSRLAIERPLRLRPVNLVALLRRVDGESVFAERAQANVSIEVKESPPLTYADEQMLSYVFSELLHNAFKAIDGKPDGQVAITITFTAITSGLSFAS